MLIHGSCGLGCTFWMETLFKPWNYGFSCTFFIVFSFSKSCCANIGCQSCGQKGIQGSGTSENIQLLQPVMWTQVLQEFVPTFFWLDSICMQFTIFFQLLITVSYQSLIKFWLRCVSKEKLSITQWVEFNARGNSRKEWWTVNSMISSRNDSDFCTKIQNDL